jgi:hypothetical protein
MEQSGPEYESWGQCYNEDQLECNDITNFFVKSSFAISANEGDCCLSYFC